MMKSKFAVIACVVTVLTAVIIAVWNTSLSRPSENVDVPTVDLTLGTDALVPTDAAADAVTQSDEAAETKAPIIVSDPDTALPDVTLSLQKVVQQDTGEEQFSRVVFGEAYKDCYLKLLGDTVELCLNPYTGKVDSGTYTYENGVMRVSLGYDRSAKYSVILSDDGQLQYIVVGRDGYDCYFG